MLMREGEDTITRHEWEPTLMLGYIVVLDERGDELFQLKQQLYSLSSPFDHRRAVETVSISQRSNSLGRTFGS